MKYLVIIILYIPITLFSQTKISGRVFDSQSNIPLSYASIGIPNKSIGTISDESGRFILDIPNELTNDTLYFSYMGYESKKIAINTLKKNQEIKLISQNIKLEAVTVTAGHENVIGRDKSGGITLIFQRADENESISGGEFAMKFNNNKTIKLESIKFFLAQNSYDSLLIRINLYDSRKTNIDQRIPITNNTILITEKETGWISKHFENNLILNRDYFVSLEIIDVSPEIGRFALTAMFTPGVRRAHVRDVSYAKWKKKAFNFSLCPIVKTIK